MTDLIVTIADEKSKQHAEELVNKGEWNNIFAVRSDLAAINSGKQIHYISIDLKRPLESCIEDLQAKLNPKCSGFDVALNIYSGSGKLHMVVISATIKLGVGFRFIAVTPNGIKEI